VSKAQAPTLTQSRIADAAVEIVGEQDPGDLAFLHTVLAQCGLPYREPGTRDYFRENGRASLVVSAGHLFDPVKRRPILQGIPYGAKPRLLMIHLCTEAVRTQSPKIRIAESMSGFMRELGLKVTGGREGTIARFKEQLNRLAASRIQLMMAFDDRAVVMNPAPVIKQFDVWFPEDPRQRMLWPSEVTLSSEFFETLISHAMPLDPLALSMSTPGSRPGCPESKVVKAMSSRGELCSCSLAQTLPTNGTSSGRCTQLSDRPWQSTRRLASSRSRAGCS
jgi:hypothetical protein